MTEETPSETPEAIMSATHRALSKHGYADLTMAAIAEEFDKSQPVLHYHYDTKEDLLVAFLEYLLERFRTQIQSRVETTGTPLEQLETLVEILLFGPEERQQDDRVDQWAFHTALLEVRAQAPYNEIFREQLTRSFEIVEEVVADTIRRGIDQGTFRPVDPERTASFILSSINGARVYQVSLDRNDIVDETHSELRRFVHESLCQTESN